MTKLRPPLTFEQAMTKVAGQIGWANIARICDKSESCVRNWSNPDTPEQNLTVRMAVDLDVAFQTAGGQGTPIFRCYATLLDVATAEAMFCLDKLAASAALMSKESGEAIAASIRALCPSADDKDRMIAIREIEESIAAATDLLAHLRAGDAEQSGETR